jgi:perosamine synthetase
MNSADPIAASSRVEIFGVRAWRPSLKNMQNLSTFIPVAEPHIGELEQRYVNQALAAKAISGTGGDFLHRFEREFAAYCGCTHGVATSSGTTALHLALSALDIQREHEVLVSTLTNMATFFAVHYEGAKPIPIDIEEDTWNLNPQLLEERISPRTKAILVVHLYGHPVDMDAVLDIARRHDLYVVEDAAEAHGALYKGRKVGSLGHIACFSFYANKILTTGEGGMITTNDKAVADRARRLCNLAYGREQRFMHEDIGFNYRMTNLQAALGCAQFEKIEKIIAGKRRVAEHYNRRLASIVGIQLPVERPYARNVYWMYHILLKKPLCGRRELVRQHLAECGIETRESFIPYNLQEIFIRKGFTFPEACPVANEVATSGLYLPSSPDLSEDQIDYIADHLIQAIRGVAH